MGSGQDIFFDYELPAGAIATHPVEPRSSARLLFCQDGEYQHRTVSNLPDLLPDNTVIVFNNSRVIPAFLAGEVVSNKKTITVNLISPMGPAIKTQHAPMMWQAMVKGMQKLHVGDVINFARDKNTDTPFLATLIEKTSDGLAWLTFHDREYFWQGLEEHGEMPIPPYFKRKPMAEDKDNYQTIFAQHHGSVASPTASLHFTEGLKEKMIAHGFTFLPLTLHIGGGTFLPIKTDIDNHIMHQEFGRISEATATQYNLAKEQGKNILALGTTTLRLLESALDNHGKLQAFSGFTDIFIKPPYRITTADYLLTNFHLSRSTLLLLVNSFIGAKATKKLYETAIEQCYRFYSYGDACLLKRQ